ncbi:MAG TPA: aldo/keto reductase [Bacillota bacterium]|nr:aldo/keto reductase [Bacillota bacterium]
MEYRYPFNDDLKIGLIGFGAWQLGNSNNWDGPNYDNGIALVKKAYELGVNFFDTAPNYADGQSEIILGQALKGIREKVFINTKVGHGPNGEYEFTPEGIIKSVHRSLERLQTDYLDSVILHNPERYVLEGHSDLIDTLQELKNKGLVKRIGVSIDTLDELQTVLTNLNIDTIEIMFNLIHQEPKYLFDEVRKRNILLIIKVPLDSGWLTGKYDKNSVFTGIRSRWDLQTIETRAIIVDRIKKILNTSDLSAPALRFIANHKAVSVVIPGIRNESQLLDNISSLDYEVSQNQMDDLDRLYEDFIKNKETPW